MIQMDGRDRLRVTLLDRMSTVETNRSSLTGLTLEAILMADKNGTPPQPPVRNQSKRTLLDVMQGEHRINHGRDKTAWKTFREKLRLKRNATLPFSSYSIPRLNTPTPDRDNDSYRHSPESGLSGRLQLGAVLAEERALSAREEETPLQPARMSLMELLEENEGQMSLVSFEGDEEEEEEEEVERVSGGGGGVAVERSCRVCMVRSKGAAFIPCGHTFCRMCSRELSVLRGNCPLCNTSILEILDLF